MISLAVDGLDGPASRETDRSPCDHSALSEMAFGFDHRVFIPDPRRIGELPLRSCPTEASAPRSTRPAAPVTSPDLGSDSMVRHQRAPRAEYQFSTRKARSVF